jgi:hypothetical protein
MKKCTKCSEIQDLSAFNRQKRNITTGLSSWCKECISKHETNKNHTPDYDGQKQCKKCLSILDRVNFFLDKRNLDGLESRCKSCCVKRARKKDIEKYGITEEQYSNMYNNQNGCCAICNSNVTGIDRTKNFSIDHCHETGNVRGLLCNWCNQGLGMFRDSSELLEKAIKYIKKNKE